MSSERGIVDILRVEGIMAQGYGINPKIVMRDKRLSPEAKCIYSYLSSFAGGGNQAFPGRDIMMNELQLGKNRYYKNLKQLIEADYVRVDRTKAEAGNIYGKNIYTLVALPSPEVCEAKEVVNAAPNDIKQKQPSSTGIKPKKLQVKKRASANELRERLEIDALKTRDSAHADLIEEVFMAIEDMDSAEQIKIGGNIKKREAIEELLNRLTAAHISLVVERVAKNKKELINRKSYLQTCIANSIFDINNKKDDGMNAVEKKKKEEFEKQSVDAQRQKAIQQMYATHPELKKMDEELIELSKKMSRAVLSGNEILHKQLQSNYTVLNQERDAFAVGHGLQDCI